MPYKRKGSPYYYTCVSIGGRQTRRSCGTTNRREAEKIEAEYLAAAADEAHTFEVVASEYLAARPNERSAYAVQALRQYFAGTVMQDLAPADIAGYKAHRRDAGTADSTIHKELATFRAALRYCQHELGWDVPADLLRGRLPKLRDGEVRWLTRAEYESLVAAAERNARAAWLPDFIRLAVNTGLRHRELLGLTWSRVDLDNGLIYLGPIDQKGGRSSSVPINATAAEVLEWRLELNESKRREDVKGSPSEYVICRTGGARIYNARKSFAQAVKRAKIAPATPHDLRHTCAAWLVQRGVTLRTVRDYMRHKSIATTMIYAHLAPDAVREAAAALE